MEKRRYTKGFYVTHHRGYHSDSFINEDEVSVEMENFKFPDSVDLQYRETHKENIQKKVEGGINFVAISKSTSPTIEIVKKRILFHFLKNRN